MSIKNLTEQIKQNRIEIEYLSANIALAESMRGGKFAGALASLFGMDDLEQWKVRLETLKQLTDQMEETNKKRQNSIPYQLQEIQADKEAGDLTRMQAIAKLTLLEVKAKNLKLDDDAKKIAAVINKLIQEEGQEVKKTAEERKRAAEERKKQADDLKAAELTLQKNTVDLMREGVAKKIATLQLEYDERMNTYRKMLRDEPKLAKEIHERELLEYKDFVEKMGALQRQQAADAAQNAFLLTPEGQIQSLRQLMGGGPPAYTAAGKRLGLLHRRAKPPWEESMKKEIQEFMGRPQTEILSRAFEVVGESIQKNIIDPLKLSNNLVGNLAKSLISTATQVLLQAAAFSVIGSIGGAGSFGDIFKSFFKSHQHGGTLWEPVYGVGTRSGRGYSFAETGPEKFMGVMSPNSARMEPMVIRIEGQMGLKGRDFTGGFVANRFLFRKGGMTRSGI
jgi:hypothetical protein